MAELKFTLQKPRPKHQRFTLVAYEAVSRTQKKYVALPENLKSDLDAINARLVQNQVTEAEATLLLKELISAQYRKSGTQATALKHAALSETNQKLLGKFWADVYAVKYLEDESSARYDFERAFRAIEPLALQVATEAAIQQQLKRKLSVKQIRRVVDRLNEVLAYLKRPFSLKKPKKPKTNVVHLNQNEFKRVQQVIGCTHCQNLANVLFGSGARLGEAMALNKQDLVGTGLTVNKQIVAYGEKLEKLPKRGKVGDVVVLVETLPHFSKWLPLSQQDKWSHRWHFNDELQKACAAAKVQKISAHDLRHSHAIHLLSMGATLTDVRSNLRNTMAVCEEYYAGYSHSEGTLDRLKHLLNGKTGK